jgi:hypothetical protein
VKRLSFDEFGEQPSTGSVCADTSAFFNERVFDERDSSKLHDMSLDECDSESRGVRRAQATLTMIKPLGLIFLFATTRSMIGAHHRQ